MIKYIFLYEYSPRDATVSAETLIKKLRKVIEDFELPDEENE